MTVPVWSDLTASDAICSYSSDVAVHWTEWIGTELERVAVLKVPGVLEAEDPALGTDDGLSASTRPLVVDCAWDWDGVVEAEKDAMSGPIARH
jgi:hypothetical protein